MTAVHPDISMNNICAYVIQIKILEEEQYSRMVEAYRAELDHVSGWMSDAKIMQEKMEAGRNNKKIY